MLVDEDSRGARAAGLDFHVPAPETEDEERAVHLRLALAAVVNLLAQIDEPDALDAAEALARWARLTQRGTPEQRSLI